MAKAKTLKLTVSVTVPGRMKGGDEARADALWVVEDLDLVTLVQDRLAYELGRETAKRIRVEGPPTLYGGHAVAG